MHGELQPALPSSGSASDAGGNRCVDAAEACTADARCQRLRTEYVARCLARAAPRSCPRARCHRALRRFFTRGPPALTHALLFCPCAGPACAERRRQTFVPACAFYGPGTVRPPCLEPLDACVQSRVCRCWGCGWGALGPGDPRSPPPCRPHRPRLLAFQASCAPVPSTPDGCQRDQGLRCLRAYAGLVGTPDPGPGAGRASPRVPLYYGRPVTRPSVSPQARLLPPTTLTTRARAWRPGATAEPAETGGRSAKPSGGSLPGTSAWVSEERGVYWPFPSHLVGRSPL